MASKSVVDMLEASSGAHFSGFHMDGLDSRTMDTEQSATTATRDVYKQPFVIGKGRQW